MLNFPGSCTLHAIDQPIAFNDTAARCSARSWLLVVLAVLLVAAPIVRCQEEEEDVPEATPAAAAVPASPLDEYTKMANEYVQKAIEVGTPYVEQAQEVAAVYVEKAKTILADTLDKLGVAKKGKTEL
jgi:bacteriorhodopsin